MMDLFRNTNVINDRFFVLFQDPNSDLPVTDPVYLERVQPHRCPTTMDFGA